MGTYVQSLLERYSNLLTKEECRTSDRRYFRTGTNWINYNKANVRFVRNTVFSLGIYLHVFILIIIFNILLIRLDILI